MAERNLLESLNSTSCTAMQKKINEFLQSHLKCKNIFIIYMSHENEEGLIQVIGDSVLDEEIRFPMNSMFDCSSGKLLSNNEFHQQLKNIMAHKLTPFPENIVKVSIKNPEKKKNICFVVCIVEPMHDQGNTKYDIKAFVKDCFHTCSAILLNAINVQELDRKRKLHEKLVFIAREHLLNLSDYNVAIREIIIEARNFINAERCSLFILSKDKSELVGSVIDCVLPDQFQSIVIPSSYGIVGFVARNGEVVNAPNAKEHPLFYSLMDKITGFNTRSILCFPVLNGEGNVVGVGEMCNKVRGIGFSSRDVDIAMIFSIYIGIALRDLDRSKSNNSPCIPAPEELLHNKTDEHDFENEMKCQNYEASNELMNFQWQARSVRVWDSLCHTFNMFKQLGFIQTWHISKKTLTCFILNVMKGYNDVPYHNWTHAFSVAHFSYYLMQSLKLMDTLLITYMEGLALLVSTLCHDLDHRGTSNSFQVLSENSLSNLYRTDGSILEATEMHHFSQMLLILNTDDCNIFENLTAEQYRRVLYLIRDMIIATDLYQHILNLPEEQEMSTAGYNPAKRIHRWLLLSLLMTCCDLNDQVKGWLYCRDIAKSIYSEFFLQGDKEKEMGVTPLDMMNREVAFIPQLQLEFLSGLCIPCFSVLVNIFPSTKYLLDTIKETEACWQRAIEWYEEQNIPKYLSFVLLHDPKLESYVLEKMAN